VLAREQADSAGNSPGKESRQEKAQVSVGRWKNKNETCLQAESCNPGVPLPLVGILMQGIIFREVLEIDSVGCDTWNVGVAGMDFCSGANGISDAGMELRCSMTRNCLQGTMTLHGAPGGHAGSPVGGSPPAGQAGAGCPPGSSRRS